LGVILKNAELQQIVILNVATFLTVLLKENARLKKQMYLVATKRKEYVAKNKLLPYNVIKIKLVIYNSNRAFVILWLQFLSL
jgi:hypothetical protein